MSKNKTVLISLAVIILAGSSCFAQTIEDNWNDFLHYTKIGRFDLAAGYAQALLDAGPEPTELLLLADENPDGYAILLKVHETKPAPELAELTEKVLQLIEQGRFDKRTDAKIIVEEIKRLSGTARGQLAAVKRLQNAGEYAIPHMIDAMSDMSRKDEMADIIWALPQIGRDAIRPLAASLQTQDVGVKAEIIKAMGKIGYPQSLPYLKYIIEKDESQELKSLAQKSIEQINPAAIKLSASQLFFQLAEKYYNHAESLNPAEDADFANIWFWDGSMRALIREKVDNDYFYELMAMRCCECALKADSLFGRAIGLWLAAFFQAESTGIEMPDYFGQGHLDAFGYATTAGPEYLHLALARAINDGNTKVALAVVEALAVTAGEQSLLSRIGPAQPLAQALMYHDKAVRYSAAIAIAQAGPKQGFPEAKLIIENLATAVAETGEKTGNNNIFGSESANTYALRAAKAMLMLAQTRNKVVDLNAAQNALIEATRDKRSEIQVLAGKILAHLNSSYAQNAICAMAISESNSMNVRVAAFKSLAESAKINANLLDDRTIDTIYTMVSSRDTNTDLRGAAAVAFGALNLPSQKVKDLILEQAKN